MIRIESGSVRLSDFVANDPAHAANARKHPLGTSDLRTLVMAGDYLLLTPTCRLSLSLAPGTRLAHLLFDVTPSPRRYNGHDIVSFATQPQPSPEEVWGHALPLHMPSSICRSLDLAWPVIRQRYWRDVAGRLRANVELAELLAQLVECSALDTSNQANAAHTATDHSHRQSISYGMQAADLVGTTVKPRDIAAQSGHSTSHFRRRFRAEEGLTAREWLIRRRLDAAMLRLAAGTSVAQAGQESGWASSTAFIAAFKQRYAMTPGQWHRRQQRGPHG